MLRESVSRLGYTGDVWATAEFKKFETKIKNPDPDLDPDPDPCHGVAVNPQW